MLAIDPAERKIIGRIFDACKSGEDWVTLWCLAGSALLAAFAVGVWLHSKLYSESSPSDTARLPNWRNLLPFGIGRPRLAPLSFAEYVTLRAAFRSLHPNSTQYQQTGFDRTLAGMLFEWTGLVAQVSGVVSPAIFITPSPSSSFPLMCSFNKKDTAKIRRLRLREQITVRGMLAPDGFLARCRLPKTEETGSAGLASVPSVDQAILILGSDGSGEHEEAAPPKRLWTPS
jgi:hypothetical protein